MTDITTLDQPPVYDPFSQDIVNNPYPTYQAMLERAPPLKNEERGFWTICRFDDVQAAGAGAHGVEDDLARVQPDELRLRRHAGKAGRRQLLQVVG